MTDPKIIDACLNSGVLQQIVSKARNLSTLNQILKEILPKEVATHCRVINFDGPTLILEADSATWATRVRYLSAELTEQFLLRGKEINKIECRVKP